MDSSLYTTFIWVALAVIIIPGPNVLVIVSTSVSHGAKRGLQTVAGTSSAMAIQLFVVAVSTTWFVRTVTAGIHYLKWIGLIYLFYLAIVHIKSALNSKRQVVQVTSSSTFTRGFLVSLSNPKTLLFFSAFLPQFVSPRWSYDLQIFILSASFLLMAMLLDSCYALLSSRLSIYAKNRDFGVMQNTVSGLLYLVTCAWILVRNRSW